MKKYLLGFLLLALIVTPFATKAVTVAELQALIAQLTAQLQSLQGNQVVVTQWGFSFTKNSGWEVVETDDTNQLKLVNKSDPSGIGDVMVMKYVAGDKVVTEDAKFGMATFYYNSTLKKWMVEKANNDGSNPVVSEAQIITHVDNSTVLGPSPVFLGTTRWKTYVFPINGIGGGFITLNISGTGWTQPLEKVLESIRPTIGSESGTPVIKLKGQKIYQAYSGGIQWLKAEFNVDVTAKGGDIYLPKDGSVNSQFQKGNVSYMTNGCQPSSSPNKVLPTVQNSLGITVYKIGKGQTVRFNSYINCPVGQLFAGSYNGLLYSLLYQTGITQSDFSFIYPKLKTGNVYIVGEKSPWIESVTSVQSGQTVTIKGERLNKGTVVIKGSSYVPSDFTYSTNGKTITFVAKEIADTNYVVYLTSPTLGDSNKVGFTINAGGSTPAYFQAYHPADLNQNWKIEKSELDAYTNLQQTQKITLKQLLRVIQFYNMGGYKVQAGTDDGFAPIDNKTISEVSIGGNPTSVSRPAYVSASWQTNGSVPNVDVLVCIKGGQCFSAQKGINNTGSVPQIRIGTNIPNNSQVFIRVQATGNTSVKADSPTFTVGTLNPATTSPVSSAQINQMANAIQSLQKLIDGLR